MKELLKLKAWDINKKKMFKVTFINFTVPEIDYEGNPGEPYHLDNFELLRYVGINDKDGDEIYYGDILKHNENIYKVIYDEVNFRVLLIHIENKDNWRELTWLKRVEKCIKKIGTVFENPELLEKTNASKSSD